MIVFTYPGQGSQTPGMGSAWVDHPSWELVEEASDATGRNIAASSIEGGECHSSVPCQFPSKHAKHAHCVVPSFTSQASSAPMPRPRP